MSHVFISYSKKDIGFARHLKWLLEAHGLRVWMDEKSIDPSEDWWATIESSVVSCSALVVIMSENAHHSRWVRREVLLAENLGKPLFPVLLNGQVWTQLADIQYADMTAGTRAELPDEFSRALTTALAVEPMRAGAVSPRRRRNTRQRLLVGAGLLTLALVVFAVILASNPFDEVRTPTPFDPVREAERLITETELARISFLTTPNHTQTVQAILERFLTETRAAQPTDTPLPTDTITPKPTEPVVMATSALADEPPGAADEVAAEAVVESPASPTATRRPTDLPTQTATPDREATATAQTQLAASLLESARLEQATLEASCPGSPSPSRLQSGVTARVTEGGLPSRLRSQPATGGEVLETIPQLEQFTVVAGPECDEQTQLRWWQVDYRGTVGWVAEGVADEYYVEPVEE
jgi:hypothetical protein